MTAHTGASHLRTARVHPKNVFHNVVISARMEVVFSTWTCVLLWRICSPLGHPYPSLEHDPVPQYRTLF
jgi:hypothetical protein